MKTNKIKKGEILFIFSLAKGVEIHQHKEQSIVLRISKGSTIYKKNKDQQFFKQSIVSSYIAHVEIEIPFYTMKEYEYYWKDCKTVGIKKITRKNAKGFPYYYEAVTLKEMVVNLIYFTSIKPISYIVNYPQLKR